MVLMVLFSARADLDDGIYAVFETSKGNFTAKLHYKKVPYTCANFIGLAEGTKKWVNANKEDLICTNPFYDGLLFHRVINGFMIQGGCPLGTGTGGPGYQFLDEFDSTLRHNKQGILSMANSGPDSNGSQFFITVAEANHLNNRHAVFGEIIEGMDVVITISKVAVDTNKKPRTDVVINRVQILRIGTEAQNFNPDSQPLPKVQSVEIDLSIFNTGVVATATQPIKCEQSMYSTSDLSDGLWDTLVNKTYWQTEQPNWSTTVPPSVKTKFFKGVRVFYPQATTNLIAGHRLTLIDFDTANSTIILEPAAGGGGISSYTTTVNSENGTISMWELYPSKCGYFFDTNIIKDLVLNFHHTSTTNGTFNGHYYYIDSGDSSKNAWYPMSGNFTDEVLTP